MTHPSDETLAQLAHGRLTGAALTTAEAHLDDCGTCRSLLAAVSNGSAPYVAAERSALTVGERLGRYEIETLIGAGGMGMLYSARDTQLNRRAVLKLMRPAFGGELGRVRLLREAQAMASLSHPNVVGVYELGESGERVFVAMELVEGGTLRDWMKSPGTWKDVVSMMVQAGRGLAAAHAAGVIHRDFKPENVLVGRDGRPRVGDFGLSRPELVAEEELPKNASMRVTRTGTMLGTPAYMSPEQLAGKPADARSYQYSFCVTLYEALTGKRPFPADTLEELRARASGGMPPPPKDGPVPAAVWAVIARGLHPDPKQRFPDMDALLTLLSAPLPEVAAEVVAAPVRERRWPKVLRTALLAMLVSGGGGGLATWAVRTWRTAPTSLPDVIHLEPGREAFFDVPAVRDVHVGGAAIRTYEVVNHQLKLVGGEPGKATLQIVLRAGRSLSAVVEVPRAADGLPDVIRLEQDQRVSFHLHGITLVRFEGDAINAVNATVEGKGEVVITGLKPGRGNVQVWTEDGRTLSSTVEVSPKPVALPPYLELMNGTRKELKLPGVTRIAIANTGVADAWVNGDVVYVKGVGAGATTLTVWTGERSQSVEVEVNDKPPPITLEVATQKVLRVPGIQRIAVGDASIADIKTIGNDQVLIIGAGPGRTTLLIWTSDGGRRVYEITVKK
jgi:hypothetical protein